MNRRKFLKTAGVGALAASAFTTNLYAKTTKTLKICLSWPKTLPIMGTNMLWFADRVKELSGGSLKVKIFGANELVPALGVFDACSKGLIDGFHAGPYYWKGKNIAFALFSSYPFGMNKNEIEAWFDFGGGMEMWSDLYGKYNLIPFKGGNTGNQMGGWFRKPIKSLADMKGLKMRIPGLGGEVMAELGVKPVNIPGGEIYTALERGVIDATEWVGPSLDIKMGFHKVAKYYYSGWHEPGSILEITLNKKKFQRLSKEHQAILKAAITETHQRITTQFEYENAVQLQNILKGKYKVHLGRFPDDVNEAAKKATIRVLEKYANQSKDFARVYDNIKKYFAIARKWSDTLPRWYLDIRDSGTIVP
jgi:TRAP-type mannitol/chloroaromatic compound transport system substrate-binding protein